MYVYDHLRDLRWIVEVRSPIAGWEVIAAFNCEPVAKRYADDCAKSNKTDYRVTQLEPVRDRETTVIHDTRSQMGAEPDLSNEKE